MLGDVKFLLRLFLRRLHYFLLVALPVALAGVWFALSLPPNYTAQARLLVESPQVPSDLAASTIRAETAELLQVIAQRILTRANLLDLSREFALHADQPNMRPDAIVADMRRRIGIALPGWGDAADFVTISFSAPQPWVTAEVVNRIVTEFLRENVALRTAAATQTLDFFDDEVARLAEDLTRQTARILEFQEANADALPDSLAFRRARQSAQQERLLQLEREMSSLRDRRDRLVVLFERTGRVDTGSESQTPEQRRLQELQNELAGALVIFAPDNPRIRLLRNQIAALEGVVNDQLASGLGGGEGMSMLDLQLADIDAQIEFVAHQREMIEAELEELRRSIEATPANAAALSGLERDFENIQAQYNQAVERRAQARIGERIEAQSRGQRITVIENAVVPDEPSSPNRRLIAAAGLGGGLVLGLAFVGLLELLKAGVRRPAEITARMGAAPFAAIPYLRTRRQTLLRRTAILALLLLLAGLVPAALWYVDQRVMPLALVVERIIDRSGLEPVLAALRPGAG